MSPKRYQPAQRIRGLDAEGNPIPVFEVKRSWPIGLARSCHARHGILVTLGVTVAAALSGRSTREVGLVLLTVLVGQFLLGVHNDLVDRERDRDNDRVDKPIAEGWYNPSSAGFAIAVAVLLVIPLSISNGVVAGCLHLGFLAVAMLTNAGVLRKGGFSFLPWAISFALLTAFLAYGGWGADGSDTPPTVALTVCAALLGVGVHVLHSLPGLVDENRAGWKTFPLRIALKIGAAKTLLATVVYLVVVGAATVAVAVSVGLRQ
ncbi:UbiA family prenyltransferase [Nocardioides alcanivorans]|uniref:UbiA family prenyltransferase n=1 Tax=Nocardioides alcanivorans TaxID=2897352 RepID=UPI001F34E7E7|nr:UbiA family prenyltransferase [Nocardioides alcanivorans]